MVVSLCYCRLRVFKVGAVVFKGGAVSFGVQIAVCVGVVAIMVAAPARAQPCALLTPEGGALGYAARANNTRCEGFYRQPSAGSAGVKLVSLTYSRIAFDRDRHQELRIGVAQPLTSPVRIHGEFVPLTRFYRLDAEIGPTQPILSVRLGDVIRPAQMSQDELGILALRSRQGVSEEVIPVVVTTDAAPVAQQGARLHLVLRPGIDVTNLRWRLRAAGQAAEYRPVPRGDGLVPAGTALRFDAEAPAASTALLDLRFFTLSGQEVTDSIRLAFR